jgi:hypothetical protein
MKEKEPVVKSKVNSKIEKLMVHYKFRSSWVTPLNRWIVRSIGMKYPFFWTTHSSDEEFMELLKLYCKENGLVNIS